CPGFEQMTAWIRDCPLMLMSSLAHRRRYSGCCRSCSTASKNSNARTRNSANGSTRTHSTRPSRPPPASSARSADRPRRPAAAALPADVPQGAFGPRLQAVLALFSGGYRIGKRGVRQLANDLFGLSISLGMVAKLERKTAAALQGPVDELRRHVRTQHANIDETGWREGGRQAWLW